MISANQPSPSVCENQPPKVAGNKIILEAKIGGITSFIDLVRAIEEVHRDAIIDEVNNARKVRWAYLEDMPILIDREARTIKSVVLRPQRNVCSPRGIFDIRRVELEGGSSFDMWFHYEI